MYIKYPKEIFKNSEIMKEELLFPCITFLSKYKSQHGMINSTIGCILQEFKINPIPRNTERIKSCLGVLNSFEVINLVSALDKINTPITLYVDDFNPWVALHDFEINTIIKLSTLSTASYKIGDLFMAIKHNAHNCNSLKDNTNSYGSVTYGYNKLLEWSGIESPNTLTKYVNLLDSTDILSVGRVTVKDKDSFKTTHEYSFKEIRNK